VTTFTRHKMSLDLTGFRGEALIPAPYRVETLAPSDLDALSVLELEGYRGTPDWDLVPELQTLEGCRSFVDDLLSGRTMFSGKQGTFRPDLSFKLVTGDTPAGVIYSLFTSDEAFIIDLVLDPAHRGRGLGTQFLTYALARYRDAGYLRAFLYVTATNYNALHLYEKMGFQVVDTYTTGPETAS
jgi:ribosomal protein S18 acetylase RimI-like enzyme